MTRFGTIKVRKMLLRDEIEKAVSVIRERCNLEPQIGIVLGTGLGGLAKQIEVEAVIPYNDIPGFPESTVETHAGRFIIGLLSGKKVAAMEGRFHYYEGYTMKQITFPIRVLKFLGCNVLMISNAAGGLNPDFSAGDIMLIKDHINLICDNPLIGPNDNKIGPRYPDMSEPYSPELIQIAEKAALEEKIMLRKGVYAVMTGPSLETAAEYRFLRIIGADAIGMSTVPEDIVAVHMGMKVLGLSVITDECLPDALKPVDIDKIIKTAAEAEPFLTKLMKRIVEWC